MSIEERIITVVLVLFQVVLLVHVALAERKDRLDDELDEIQSKKRMLVPVDKLGITYEVVEDTFTVPDGTKLPIEGVIDGETAKEIYSKQRR